MRQMSLHLLLCHLLIAGVGSVCVDVLCLKCNTTGLEGSCSVCPGRTCINVSASNLTNCKKDFKVDIISNKPDGGYKEGSDITLNCTHDLRDLNLTFEWKKSGEIMKGQNTSRLSLKKVFQRDDGQYSCSVNSTCGNYESSPHDVTVKNEAVVLLVICGVAALVLVVVMGVAMKYKLKRDNAKHKERMKQRVQDGQSAAPPPFAPRES